MSLLALSATFRGLYPKLAFNEQKSRFLKTLRVRRDHNTAALPTLSADDDQCQPIKRIAVFGREGRHVGGIAVVGCDNVTGSSDFEVNRIHGARNHPAALI